MAKKKVRKKKTPMEILTAGYEGFIKDKQVNKNGKAIFDKTIKKASKPRAAK